jgi:nucleoside-diphosphate-sugar epimerase
VTVPTRLLVLGGTQFLGRAVAVEAVRRGAEVVVVHRGEHESPPGVTALRADRTSPDEWSRVAAELAAGDDRPRWDVVVDTWSGDPSAVRRSTASLRRAAGRYVYVSSRSVYAWPAPADADENAPVVDLPRWALGESTAGGEEADLSYAEQKRAAEVAVERAFGDRALILRVGLLIGPRENSGRLPWWLARMARGGEVPVPGPADLDWQYVDARDLAAWMLTAAARGLGGVFDAVGRRGGTTTEEILRLCAEVTGGGATLRWLDPAVFAAAGVQPWTDLPGWFPPGPEHAAVHRGNAGKAHRHGLVQRPLRDTVADTWSWMSEQDGGEPVRDRQGGLSPELERRLLEAAGGADDRR